MKKQTIIIDSYPATFSFEIEGELPKFYNGRRRFKYCDVRNDLLRKHMRILKVYSPCHDYGDYVVEHVTKTPRGEVWELGS